MMFNKWLCNILENSNLHSLLGQLSLDVKSLESMLLNEPSTDCRASDVQDDYQIEFDIPPHDAWISHLTDENAV